MASVIWEPVDSNGTIALVELDMRAGQADVVVALENAGKVQWFQMVNGGPASEQHIITANVLLLPMNLNVIDMDADGDPDIVTAPPFERTTWLENDGSASFLLRSTPIRRPR
ncbi:MAG: VCBS repeat-containing protein [Flavobacteriales bacterium]|nr:VCBS repeat-containing protein [Flavobacteriales bacterium]